MKKKKIKFFKKQRPDIKKLKTKIKNGQKKGPKINFDFFFQNQKISQTCGLHAKNQQNCSKNEDVRPKSLK